MKLALASLLLILAQAAAAQPGRDEVVEVFPPRFSKRAVELRATVAQSLPENDAVRLAEELLEQGKSLADMTPINLAASLLERFAGQPGAKPKTLMTLAACKSYKHDFPGAIRLFERASAEGEARNQADLQLISILITTGRFEEARARFSRNPSLMGDSRGMTLISLLASMTGKLQLAYETLQRAETAGTSLSSAERRWQLAILAEMADRLGDSAAAERCYTTALSLSKTDMFLSSAWLNFLIRAGRREEARLFVHDSPLRDKLGLWSAIAGLAHQSPAEFEEQFTRSTVHERERAIFLLKVKNDPAAALEAALSNWSIQKETIDVRLVFECAAATGNPSAADPVRRWAKANRYEDICLKGAL